MLARYCASVRASFFRPKTMYEPRGYRDYLHQSDLTSFKVSYRESDLWIAVTPEAYSEEMKNACFLKTRELYLTLEDHIKTDPVFLHSLQPCKIGDDAPSLAKIMAAAATRASVGPMAAVAGAVAQEIGVFLVNEFAAAETIVENGGDIYLATAAVRHVALSAGASPLSGRLALRVPPALSPLSICTSSGTVGPSLSFGKADAVTLLAKDAALADAYATAVGNMVKTAADIDKALAYAARQESILGTVIIVGDRIGFQGKVDLVKV